MSLLKISQVEGGVQFQVRVQPRASRREVAGVEEGVLRLRLTAPPVEGAANEACREFLAGLLGVPRARVAIVGGLKSRLKLVKVEGMSPAAVLEALK